MYFAIPMLSTHEKVVNDLTRCATCYKAEELEIKKKKLLQKYGHKLVKTLSHI